MKPIFNAARGSRGNEEVRLLALGLFEQEARLDLGAVVGIAASAIRMLQDNLAEPSNVPKRVDGRCPRNLTTGGATSFGGFAEADIPAAGVRNVAAIMTSTERISRWGYDIPFELEIDRGLSAVVYGRNEFRSAFLALVGDVQIALAQDGRFMANVERTDGSSRGVDRKVARNPRSGEDDDEVGCVDVRRMFADLLSLTQAACDGGPGLAVALDFSLCHHRLLESGTAAGARQCVVMRLQRIWLTHEDAPGSRNRQLPAMPPRESISIL